MTRREGVSLFALIVGSLVVIVISLSLIGIIGSGVAR